MRIGWTIRAGVALSLTLCVSGFAQTLELPFYEGFEPVGGDPGDCTQDDRGNWSYELEWEACSAPFSFNCPVESYPDPDSDGWGPVKLESWPDLCAGGKVFEGYRAARQVLADPYWYSMYHDFLPPQEIGDLHAEVWQYDPASVVCTCECNCDPDGPKFGFPDGRPNYQVQAWLFLTNPERSEYFVIGVNSYTSWTRLSWATKTDGWHATDFPRTAGWRKLEIIVHPYSGEVGDVEFKVDGQVVASGRRVADQQVSRIRLGGDPALITQNHLTNTFEEIWYDEVRVFFEPQLCNTPRFDHDGDLDVDQEDFGAFQACFTGPTGELRPVDCGCMDADGDLDVDMDDYTLFVNCATFPASGTPPPAGCDQPQ